ncbi:uncharacterized protein BJ212DRAFT_1354969 [Suillus subaureus]|uniref:Uncharacterized protein n=1 Tax=Suillus subaureus TaxID=48587 RepID=A0A9P7EC12_9AGAM|nr:uncharacterized protein BJ212DRAFT_1354969 [Suillus subaureus]KAG1816472.1 hypothetical protein BJ212DRAFT_1354969 [Suillus subaureus]
MITTSIPISSIADNAGVMLSEGQSIRLEAIGGKNLLKSLPSAHARRELIICPSNSVKWDSRD